MTDLSPRKPAAPWLIAVIAALAGAAAVALYAKLPAADNSAASADAGRCTAREEAAKAAGAFAAGDVAAMAPAAPRDMTDIAFTGPDGAPMTLAAFKGRMVLLNLWATWCAPCRAEMPALDRLQAAKGGEAFQVVALNLDRGTDSKPQDFLAEIGVKNLALYRDGSLKSFNALKGAGLAFGLPVTMLIDRDGCLLTAMNGPTHWDGPDALRFIDGVTAAQSSSN